MIKNVTEYLDNSALRFPDKIAFCYSETSVTFKELREQSQRIASTILLHGCFKQPIVVAMRNKVFSVVTFMAAAYSGNFYIPIDVEMPESRLRKILDILQSDIILTDDEKGGQVYNLLLASGISADQIYFYNDILKNEASYGLLEEAQRRQIDTDLLYVLFTSGSTGIPKGVGISHRAIIDHVDWYSKEFGIDENTIFGGQASLFFDLSVSELYSTLKQGCKTVFIPPKFLVSLLQLPDFLNENEINTIYWIPSLICAIANLGLLEKKPLKYIKKVLFNGESMPNKQLNIWRKMMPHALYVNCYGPTEITNACTYYIINRDFKDNEPLPIGFPCENTEILLLNDENNIVKDREIGEICVRGTCLSNGYYGRPDLTENVFIQNPTHNNYRDIIYRTGDLGFYNEREELCFAGRKDYQIKHKGYRIELGEIEVAALGFEEVKASVAIYDDSVDKICLFVIPSSVDKQKLYEYMKSNLTHYMMPAVIEAIDSFPMNQNGKIDRKKVRELLNEQD